MRRSLHAEPAALTVVGEHGGLVVGLRVGEVASVEYARQGDSVADVDASFEDRPSKGERATEARLRAEPMGRGLGRQGR